MNEHRTANEELVNRYFDSLNETDGTRRSDLIKQIWTEKAKFGVPFGEAEGHDAIAALIEETQKRFPNSKVRRTGAIEGFGDNLKFGFLLSQADETPIISGVDFATVADGKMQLVVGFFDAVPQSSANSAQAEIVNTAKQVYQAFNASDISTWLTFFAPTFEWHAADNSPIADHSPYRGLDAIQDEVFPRLAALFPGMQLRVDELFAIENKAIMLGYYYNLPQKVGGTTEAQVAHVLTFESGKIVKFQQYLDTYKFSKL